MRVRTSVRFLAIVLLFIPGILWAQASIRIGETRHGSLADSDKRLQEDGSYYDRYTLQGRSGQHIKIELKSKSFDPYLVLLDGDGTEIASSCGERAARKAHIEITLPHSGKYHLRVNSLHKGGVGEYVLELK